jgi:N-acyl-D-aspartate/D-glutamate deacylase
MNTQMKNLLILIIITISIFSCVSKTEPSKVEYYDLVITNGNIIDGTGKISFSSNLYIRDDSIAHIGNLTSKNIIVKDTLDADGMVVSPGFIDLHAHGNPIETPEFENFLAMGVTTITLGQDGSSPEVTNINDYFGKINLDKMGPNLIQFIGHGTLRNLSGIGIKNDPSEKEMESMINLLEQNLKFCFGLSFGLEYAPGIYAKTDELNNLAIVVGKNSRMIMSHMRNEDDDAIIKSIEELAKQGKYARVHISHLKSVYGKGQARAIEILDTIKLLRNKGIPLTADIYPYIASYTGISIVFPDWSKTKSQFNKVKKYRRKELESFIKKKVNLRNGPEATLFGTDPYKGKTLAQVAKDHNKPFETFLIEDLGPQGASAAYFVMDKELQNTLLTDPVLSICSDGSLTGSHPRGHGTFAKIIEDFVVNEKSLALEEAIRKMTSYPATILNLQDRGILKPRFKADIIIFDPNKVKAIADYSSPHQLAKGFEFVIVNGKIIKRNGKLSPNLSGKILIPK